MNRSIEQRHEPGETQVVVDRDGPHPFLRFLRSAPSKAGVEKAVETIRGEDSCHWQCVSGGRELTAHGTRGSNTCPEENVRATVCADPFKVSNKVLRARPRSPRSPRSHRSNSNSNSDSLNRRMDIRRAISNVDFEKSRNTRE